MSDYPKIDDFLDAVEDSTDQAWTSNLQQLYNAALDECVFADRVVKEMLPYEWEDWVIKGIAKHTPSGKWMSAIAPQFWGGQVHNHLPPNQIDILLLGGCALEHSNVGQNCLGFFNTGPETVAIAKRLVQRDDDTIVGVLEASSKNSSTVVVTLLPALVDEGWDFNAAWEKSQDNQFQKWIQRMVKTSHGGCVFAPLVGGLSKSNLEDFSQWVVNFMIEESVKNDKKAGDMEHYDIIFERMPPDVAQKWVDYLSVHTHNPKLYGPLVGALLQNKQLRDVVSETSSPEVARRKM